MQFPLCLMNTLENLYIQIGKKFSGGNIAKLYRNTAHSLNTLLPICIVQYLADKCGVEKV